MVLLTTDEYTGLETPRQPIRDPNNPNVIWDEGKNDWYDTVSRRLWGPNKDWGYGATPAGPTDWQHAYDVSKYTPVAEEGVVDPTGEYYEKIPRGLLPGVDATYGAEYAQAERDWEDRFRAAEPLAETRLPYREQDWLQQPAPYMGQGVRKAFDIQGVTDPTYQNILDMWKPEPEAPFRAGPGAALNTGLPAGSAPRMTPWGELPIERQREVEMQVPASTLQREYNRGFGGTTPDPFAWAMQSLIPKDLLSKAPNPWYFPARDVIGGLTSPLGIATIPVGGTFAGGVAKGLGRTGLAALGATYGAEAGGAVAEQVGAPEWVGQLGGGLAGGVGGWYGPEIGRAGAKGLAKARVWEAEPVEMMGGQIVRRGEAGGVVRSKTKVAAKSTDPFDAAVVKIEDSLRAQQKYRLSGTAEAENIAGRAAQAGATLRRIEKGLNLEQSPEEIAGAARQASAVGSFQREVLPGVAFTDVEKNAVVGRVLTDINQGKLPWFENYRVAGADSALEKIIDGRRLQPNELEWARKTFGPKVGDLLERQNVKLPTGMARLLPEDLADIARIKAARGEADSLIRKQELIGQRQRELASQLDDQAKLHPTTPAWKKAAEEAQRRAVQADSEVNRLEVREATRWAEKKAVVAKREEQQTLQKATNAAARNQEVADRAAQAAKWKTIAAQNELDQAALDELNNMVRTSDEMRAIGQGQLTAPAERLQSQAGRVAEKAMAPPSPGQVLGARGDIPKELSQSVSRVNATAYKLIDDAVEDEGQRVILKKAVEHWTTQQEGLTRLKGDTNYIDKRLLQMAGDPADSYLATILHSRNDLIRALEYTGSMSVDDARKLADVLLERELKLRYRQGVPANMRQFVDETKLHPFGPDNIISGTASVSQEWKNMQFGIGDMAVFGQQVLHAAQGGGPNIIAGMVNRMLNLAHAGIQTVPEGLPRRIAFAIDGVPQGVMTGITDVSREGTLLRHFGRAGMTLDEKAIVPFVRALTNFQFGKVLGSIRNLNHEGNLVLAKMVGQDVMDPKVRYAAAMFADSNTSYWKPALKAQRAAAEKAAILSPPMLRARIAQILQVGKLVSPASSPTERMLAATAIASWGASTLATGKLVTDYFGGEIELDPSKPGFGMMKLPGMTMQVFPQLAVAKAVVRSFRALSEGDVEGVGEAWLKLALSSSSPPFRIFEAAAGLGYDPQRGWQIGDYGKGMGAAERVWNTRS